MRSLAVLLVLLACLAKEGRAYDFLTLSRWASRRQAALRARLLSSAAVCRCLSQLLSVCVACRLLVGGDPPMPSDGSRCLMAPVGESASAPPTPAANAGRTNRLLLDSSLATHQSPICLLPNSGTLQGVAPKRMLQERRGRSAVHLTALVRLPLSSCLGGRAAAGLSSACVCPPHQPLSFNATLPSPLTTPLKVRPGLHRQRPGTASARDNDPSPLPTPPTGRSLTLHTGRPSP